jgi:WS/DGAT/MGAT family acyltransferase
LQPDGEERELLDLAASFVSGPFDTNRPLWQLLIIEGLAGGRGALVQKVHHSLSDAQNEVELGMQFIDLVRNPPVSPDTDVAETAAVAGRPPSIRTDVVAAVARSARCSTDVSRRVAGVLRHPAGLLEVPGHAVRTTRSSLVHLIDTRSSLSPLWQRRTAARRLETVRVPLEPLLAAARTLGGTLNVAFLTATAAAAGSYHARRGAPIDSLRATMATSTRTAGSGGNAFNVVRLRVPTCSMPMAERFEVVRTCADEALSGSGFANFGTLARFANVAGALPTPILSAFARAIAGSVDFVTSSVRTAPVACFIAGAKIEENYALGPLPGPAFNLTALSYCDSLDLGLHLDPGAVGEPRLLRACVEESFAKLVDVGSAV